MSGLRSDAEARPGVRRLLALLLPPAFGLYATFSRVQLVNLDSPYQKSKQSIPREKWAARAHHHALFRRLGARTSERRRDLRRDSQSLWTPGRPETETWNKALDRSMKQLRSDAEARPGVRRLLALLLPPAFGLYATFNGVHQISIPLQVEAALQDYVGVASLPGHGPQIAAGLVN